MTQPEITNNLCRNFKRTSNAPQKEKYGPDTFSQTEGHMNGRTDGQTDTVIPICPKNIVCMGGGVYDKASEANF